MCSACPVVSKTSLFIFFQFSVEPTRQIMSFLNPVILNTVPYDQRREREVVALSTVLYPFRRIHRNRYRTVCNKYSEYFLLSTYDVNSNGELSTSIIEFKSVKPVFVVTYPFFMQCIHISTYASVKQYRIQFFIVPVGHIIYP